MTCPCKGCSKRVVGCHGQCAAYQEYHTGREKIRKARQLEQTARYVKINSVIDWAKREFRTRRK